jgi:copper chaperone
LSFNWHKIQALQRLPGFSMNEIILSVTGMTCGGCVNSVQKVLAALPGVQNVEVTLTPGQARVLVDPARVDRAALVQAVVDAGFGVGD